MSQTLSHIEPKRPMWRLFKYLFTYKYSFWLSVLASILNKIFDLMPPLIVGWVVASLNGQVPTWISFFVNPNHPWHLAIFLGGLAIIIFGLESIAQWAYDYGFMSLAQRVQHNLRVMTYTQVQDREIAFFEQHRVGETMAMLNDDINQLERFLNSGLNDIIQLATLIIFSSYVFLNSNWQLALVGLAPVPIIILASIKFQQYIAPRYQQIRQKVGELSTRLENNLSGIVVIKSFTAENFETQRVETSSQNYRDANFHAIKLSAIFVPLIRMLVAIGFGSVLSLGSYWILTGKHDFTVAELVVFVMLIQRVLWPLTRLGNTIDDYERAQASARRTFGLLDTQSTIQESKHPIILSHAKGEINFEHVSFNYSNHVSIFKDLNFKIMPGETVGIAGHTGAGKSTLIKLLLRLYDVTSGTISIDGHDIRNLSLNDLRRNIALVSQDVYLFHGNIAENIAYGFTNATQTQIINAAKAAHLHEFIETLPDGYNTLIGERGIKLSGGQRQRLSIARAILKDAPILVLDEATSAVDTETEREIQQNLQDITTNRTALIIAHRLSTIRNANKIIVIKEGQVVEQGRHDELIALNGNYADLWHIQIGNPHKRF